MAGTQGRPPKQRVCPPMLLSPSPLCLQHRQALKHGEGGFLSQPRNPAFCPLGQEGTLSRTSGSTSLQPRPKQNSCLF